MSQFERLTAMLIKFERGEMTEVDEIIEFSQRLIDNGLDASSSGHYSGIVQNLIDKGKVSKDKRLKSIRFLKGLKFD
jgi:hypothetical protein